MTDFMGPNTYDGFASWIRAGRNPDYRKLANNTYAVWPNQIGGNIAIKLHNTLILHYSSGDWVTYQTGNWYTYTTKDRLNQFGPSGFTVYQDKRVWYFVPRVGETVRFWDGVTVSIGTGQIINPESAPDFASVDAHNRQLAKLAREYVRGLDDVRIRALVETPTSGDCFYCLAGFTGGDHLVSHMRERYWMTSLLVNAYTDRGLTPLALMIDSEHSPARVRETVQRFLIRRTNEMVAI